MFRHLTVRPDAQCASFSAAVSSQMAKQPRKARGRSNVRFRTPYVAHELTLVSRNPEAWAAGALQNKPTAADSIFVRGSVQVKNSDPARGGDVAPTLDNLRSKVPSARQMQSRVVSKQDLLSRIYTLPNEFGRVYRAGIRQNPVNPLSAQLFIISRDRTGALAVSPDALKKNLSTYLNEYRLISDAIDILDASISNFTVKFTIMTAPGTNKTSVIQNTISRIKEIMTIKNFQIDQPILLDDITNVIIKYVREFNKFFNK